MQDVEPEKAVEAIRTIEPITAIRIKGGGFVIETQKDHDVRPDLFHLAETTYVGSAVHPGVESLPVYLHLLRNSSNVSVNNAKNIKWVAMETTPDLLYVPGAG